MLLWRSVNMIPDQVRAKTVKLVFVASLLCIWYRKDWLVWIEEYVLEWKSYLWFWLWKRISHSNIVLKVKPEKWDVMRSPFQAKHINNSVYQGSDKVTSLNWYLLLLCCAYRKDWLVWIEEYVLEWKYMSTQLTFVSMS
jgi:hypothetical protein